MQLTVNQVTPANQLPVAVATQTFNAAGTTASYDARSSHDPDGSIASYEWDFGDGTIATGPTVTHSYNGLGQLYQPTLIVTDNGGAQGFFGLTNVKVHYGFNGFGPPVNQTGVTQRNAGAALPFKWSLTDPAGNRVTGSSNVTSYGFDAPGATYSLEPEGDQYVIVAKTPKSWAGSRHTFTVVLNDHSVHTAVVQF